LVFLSGVKKMVEAIVVLCAVIVILVCALYHYTSKLVSLEYGLLTVRHELSPLQNLVICSAWGAYQRGESECHGYKLPEPDNLL
jgi:hypothetical protein